jgi:hypothetical protein
LENLEEIDRLLDSYVHPKLNQENINHLNTSITNNEIEAVIKNFQQEQKPQDKIGSLLNFTTF